MKPGIYTAEQLSNDEYHAADGISCSGLSLVLRSPAHYQFQPKKADTRAMQIGTALHCAVLEPERFSSSYMLLKDITDRRKSEYKQAVAVWGDQFVLSGTEADQVAGMQESARSNPHLAGYLSAPGRYELSVFATDPETGVLVKCRFDKLLDAGVGFDLKKTQDIRDFAKSVANYGYHMQEAFYRDVYKWATGEDLRGFAFGAVEEMLPHASAPFVLDEEALDIGRMLYRKALNEYADCLAADEWPGIACEPQTIQLPSWYINQFENESEVKFDGE